MAAKLYDYLNNRNENEISVWLRGLPTKQLSKIVAKLELLKRYGDETLPGFVTPAVGSGSIKEICLKGDRALRLLMCRGPFKIGRHPAKKGPRLKAPSIWASPEFTLLFGAEERDGKYVPRDAVLQAENRRDIVLGNPKRREEHVYIGPDDT